MEKGNASKFIKGAAVGVALGVAAGLFLSSKKGKELQKDIKGVLADFYKQISPKVKKIEKMGEKEYKEFMKNAVEKYSAAKKLSSQMAKDLMSEMQKSWSHFSKHLQD